MSAFTESNTIEAHLHHLLAGAASARPAQFDPGLVRTAGRIVGFRHARGSYLLVGLPAAISGRMGKI
ncbi:hypothetical protein [Ensifer sp. ENS11]|uniref:hypothetical protein n=1 Tax=Ensifer sp. ENS11 TaxID=2769291 RepID=UPI0017808293|nr:hypothetical protein [Ensifer sp. ENS11]MBD9488750.1 hypothetical protein [Ensifer sp. ENS11]